jgi:hypothetical protein
MLSSTRGKRPTARMAQNRIAQKRKTREACAFYQPTSARRLERFRAKLVLGLDRRMDAGLREDNASNQDHRAPLLIPAEAERL